MQHIIIIFCLHSDMIHSRSCCYTSHNTFNSFFLYAFRFHDFFLCVCAAPPSLPVCLWEGDTEAGGNVQLSCLVAEGFPTPQVIWEKLEPDKMTLPVNMHGKKKKLYHRGTKHIRHTETTFHTCICRRWHDGLGAHCQCVCADLWPLPLLSDQPTGNPALLH